MSWLGGILGFACGRHFGGILGGIAGAVLGNMFENKLRKNAADQQQSFGPRPSGRTRTAAEKELIFLTAVGAMLAKLSKADGHVDQSEIAAGERAFVRLGLTDEKRAFCIHAFRTAKMDGHSVYDYADAFVSTVQSHAVRELFYDILWDVACADGVLAEEELEMLRGLASSLQLPAGSFERQWARRAGGGSGSRRTGGAADWESAESPYDVLGCSPDATDAELRRAFREKAKRLHPDLLRAQGLPDELVEKANEQMARLNAAWDRIRRERNLK